MNTVTTPCSVVKTSATTDRLFDVARRAEEMSNAYAETVGQMQRAYPMEDHLEHINKLNTLSRSARLAKQVAHRAQLASSRIRVPVKEHFTPPACTGNWGSHGWDKSW